MHLSLKIVKKNKNNKNAFEFLSLSNTYFVLYGKMSGLFVESNCTIGT